MNVVILTPEKEAFRGSATSIKVPGMNGDFEVLQNHAPVVSSLDAGTIRVLTDDGSKLTFKIRSGFVEVLNNEVSVLAQGLKEQ